MKTLHTLLPIVFLLHVAGCAATPEDRWFQQRDLLTTANRVYLAHVPVMADEQVLYYGQLLQAARAKLDEAKNELPDGGSDFESALSLAESLLVCVIEMEDQEQPLTTEETSNDPN